MDIILDRADELVFDPLYSSVLPDWHRGHLGRQFLSLYAIILVGVATLYFLFATSVTVAPRVRAAADGDEDPGLATTSSSTTG